MFGSTRLWACSGVLKQYLVVVVPLLVLLLIGSLGHLALLAQRARNTERFSGGGAAKTDGVVKLGVTSSNVDFEEISSVLLVSYRR